LPPLSLSTLSLKFSLSLFNPKASKGRKGERKREREEEKQRERERDRARWIDR
jgi:hypothetical protein